MEIDRTTKKAIQEYVLKLPDELKRRYGGSGNGPYTQAQVEKTVADLGLSADHVEYALAMFCESSALMDALARDHHAAKRVLQVLEKISVSGFIDASGWTPATWVTKTLVDTLTSDDVGEIGAEGDAT